MLRTCVNICILFFLPTTVLALEKSYSVEELISKAYSHSPEIASDSFKMKASSHLKGAFNYIPDPSLKFNYFTDPIETRNGPQRYNIMVTQSIPWPGTVVAKGKQARFKEEAFSHKKEAGLRRLGLEVRTLFATITSLKAIRDTRTEKLEALKVLKKLILARSSVAKSSLADISRIEIEVTDLEQSLLELDLNLQRSLFSLEELVGERLDQSSFSSAFEEEGFSLSQKASNEALKDHPLFKATLAQVKLAEAKKSVEQSKYFPKFSLFASWYKIEKPDPSFAGAANPGKDAFSFGFSLTVPLWTVFSGRSSYEEGLRRASESDSRGVALKLKKLADSSLEELKTYEDIINLYEHKSLPSAKKALKLDLESYSQGAVTVDQIVRDYNKLQDIESRLITAKKLKFISKSRLISLGL